MNPLRTRRFAGEDLQRTQTDAIDAVGIARFAAQKRPPASRLPDRATEELRELVRFRDRLRQDFGDRVRQLFLRGRTFASWEDLRAQARHWLDTVANVRVHGTTRRRVDEAYAEEQPCLIALPAVAYPAERRETRTVQKDGDAGFSDLGRDAANELFRVVCARYRQRSTIVVSNRASVQSRGTRHHRVGAGRVPVRSSRVRIQRSGRESGDPVRGHQRSADVRPDPRSRRRAERSIEGDRRALITAETLIRLPGVGLVVSGVLATIGFSIHPHDPVGPNHAAWIGGHVLILLGFAAGWLGLVGLYTVAAARAGVAGLVGFLLASASLILYLGKLYWAAFIYPLVIRQHPQFVAEHGLSPGAHPADPVLNAVFYLGPGTLRSRYTVLGAAVLKAGIFPRLPVGLVVAGSLLVGLWALLPTEIQHFSVLVSLVFTVGIAWLGYVLITGRYRPR